MGVRIEVEQEDDGRWLAEIPLLPGCMAYGVDRKEAVRAVEILALQILADRVAASEELPPEFSSMFQVAA